MAVNPDQLARLPWKLRAEIAENVMREDFTEEELARIQLLAWDHLSEQGRRTDLETSGPSGPEVEAGVAEKIGALFGEGRNTVKRRIAVVRAADEEPEKYRRLVDQMNRSGEVNAAYKQLRRDKTAEEIRAEPQPEGITGQFRVIAADPPWSYQKRKDDLTHRTALPYPDMNVRDICTLHVDGRHVADLAGDDAVLWLWTTNAHMREAFDVLDAWDFQHKTILTWVKDRMGTGDWLRGQTEHCVLAVRGKPTILLSNQTTVLHGPLREHSRKPDEFYALVNALCPGSKLELFGRQKREGWVVWGAEKGQFSGT